MKRRVLATAAAAATALAVVPAAPAFASANATAALVAADQQIYPGAESFQITVTNNEAAGFLGIGAGKTINAIRVNLPVSEAGVRLTSSAGSATGFTEAVATNLGTTQFVTYRGGSLAPGATTTITLPADVARPVARDLKGDFRVQVSSDGFQTAKTAAGSLVTEVNVLKVLSLAPVKPVEGAKGVADEVGTVGQTVTYRTEVQNFSQSTLPVTAGISSSGLGDTPGSTPVSLAPGETKAVEVPLTLSDAAGLRNVAGTATASNADAPRLDDTFTAQARALLTPSSLDGQRTSAGPGSSRDFTVTLSKEGAQAVDAVSASLTFGSNSCGMVEKPTFAPGAGSTQVTFRCIDVQGTDGPLPAQIAYSLTDDNLATYGRTISVGSIIIDTLSPVLTLNVVLPNDADGDPQTAVKNGNTITVEGTISNAADLAPGPVRVTLTPNAGPSQTIDGTVSGDGAAKTFRGSRALSWDASATSFGAGAEIADTAGNLGTVQSPVRTVIDNVLPVLNNPGVVVDPTTIEVVFDDATGVKGGCDARMWLIDGQPNRVSQVKGVAGSDCATTDAKTRQLVLSSPLAVDQTPTVTYDPSFGRTIFANRRPAKDGAGNDAIRQVVDTITNLVPLAPEIVSLTRRDSGSAGYEPAYYDVDEKRYFTNVGGADALELTVSGVKQNYTVQVFNGDTLVGSRKFTAAPSPLAGSTAEQGSVLIALPAADSVNDLRVRFLSAVGNEGAATPFQVVLERVAPTLAGRTFDGAGTVTQSFSEKVVSGSDFADNWFVSETVATETGTAKRTVNVDAVAAPDLLTRTLSVTLLDPSKFAGTDYYVQSGTRYEDRAGNVLADTLRPVS